MTLIPPRLRIGDTIGIVTPSGQISDSPSPNPQVELEAGIKYLKDLGFEIKLGMYAMKEGDFGAGTPEERAEDLNAMFANTQNFNRPLGSWCLCVDAAVDLGSMFSNAAKFNNGDDIEGTQAIRLWNVAGVAFPPPPTHPSGRQQALPPRECVCRPHVLQLPA